MKIDSELGDPCKVIKSKSSHANFRAILSVEIKLLYSLSSVVFVRLNLKEMYNYIEIHMNIDH
jgi:hypothetical protein